MQIKFKKLHPDAKAPFRAHPDDRGADLFAVDIENIMIGATVAFRVKSGIALEYPPGIDGEVRARSSIYKTGWILSNGVGTIDHSYRGEITAVFYIAADGAGYEVGDRFAQLVIPGVDPRDIEFVEVNELSKTERGCGGYGSTGIR